MLEIKNISKTFNPGTVNEKVALDDVSLTLENGDFVTVIGGNGAGKSTLLNAIAGVWPVDCGQIIIDGQDVTKLSEHKRAAFLGRVFQDPMNGTAATMGIEENLALALRRGTLRPFAAGSKAASGRRTGNCCPNWVWSGKPPDQQSGTSVRRTETGADPSDGDAEET